MRWTDAERNILRDNYYVVDDTFLAFMLPGRSRKTIIEQVHYLRKRGWAFKGRLKK